jgi:hypothetical protein
VEAACRGPRWSSAAVDYRTYVNEASKEAKPMAALTNALTSPSRWLVATAALLGFLLFGAGLAAACTIYWGTTVIEGDTDGDGSADTGEYSVVGDPGPDGGNGMDRCDQAGSGSVFTVSNDDPDKVLVEIDAYNGPDDCERDHGDTDGDGSDDHSLADALSDEDDDGVSDEFVYVNTYDGDAYDDDPNSELLDDDDGNGVYEDTDDGQHGGEEPGGESSTERDGDCMGDGQSITGDDSAVKNKAQANVIMTGSDAGQFHNTGDDDGDGVNDVWITIDEAQDSSSQHASAVCVSDGSGGDSAPQIPMEIS